MPTVYPIFWTANASEKQLRRTRAARKTAGFPPAAATREIDGICLCINKLKARLARASQSLDLGRDFSTRMHARNAYSGSRFSTVLVLTERLAAGGTDRRRSRK